MFNKVLLWIAVFASLIWIGYVGFDILNESNNYSPEKLFGFQDEKVLIINRPEEVKIHQLTDFANAPSSEVVSTLNPQSFTTGYVSANQAHILLFKSSNWSKEDIEQLFLNTDEKPSINAGSFTYMGFEGRFYKKGLYMKKGEVQLPENSLPRYLYDKNASASVVHFTENSAVQSVSDIYFKEGDRIDYITYNEEIEQGNQVKDEVIFAGIVTKNFNTYHFVERDYYASMDSTFVSGPMYKWMLNGFLDLDYEGARVIISDYIDGQDPILILNDLKQSQDVSQFNNRLTRDFPTAGKDFHIKYLEDLVVICEDESICDKVIADFKLGNTIALHKEVRNKIYGALPNSVSERIITKEHSYSKAVYRGKLLETQMGIARQTNSEIVRKESIAMNCDFDILDFATVGAEGEVVALGKSGELARFKNGKIAWTKNLGQKAMGSLDLIDLHQTGEQFILINTPDKIHLWNMDGEVVSGFPIALEKEATNEVKFYRWKGKSFFLIANEAKEVVHFDSKGRELNVIRSPFTISRKIDVWASQRTLFAGFASDDQFIMYNLDASKEHRSFELPVACLSAKVPNELLQYGIQDNHLIKLDQKGIKSTFGEFNRAQLKFIQTSKKVPTIVVQSANEIHLINEEGLSFSQITLPFNEIEHVFIETSNSGKTTVAIIDGLENNVYLYGLDGERVTLKPIEGQTKVLVKSTGSTRVITTVVDQYIVQYFE